MGIRTKKRSRFRKKVQIFEQKMSYLGLYLAVWDRDFTDRKLSKNDGDRWNPGLKRPNISQDATFFAKKSEPFF